MKNDKEKGLNKFAMDTRIGGIMINEKNALLQISKCRESVEDLAVWLLVFIWDCEVCFSLESICLYNKYESYLVFCFKKSLAFTPYILPPTLTAVQSNRVCNALALMQCIASHRDTETVRKQNPALPLSVLAYNQ
ncbi:hypothetical protein Mgra_00005701 [Meloidogyne graminicola]|uniref:CCR4-NOT transcription complex subunit 9 n=1 Tax=Meloidogyne graminicola TaxID=189291 RepID=A0A8S9ZNR3_9BILA|nr:hypothetical protein Mgra_00005701 [Meloidogyne graminicola]